jgi:hypothetical protein
MPVPGYAAEASLQATNRSYRAVRRGRAVSTHPTVVAQHDPCDMGGGGVRPIPMACPVGQRCCGSIRQGECIGRCWPSDQPCP